MMPMFGLTRQSFGTVVITLKPMFLLDGFVIVRVAVAPPPIGPI